MIALSEHITISKKIKNVVHVYQVHKSVYDDECNIVKRVLLGTYLNKQTAINDLEGIYKSVSALHQRDHVQAEYHDLDVTLDNFSIFINGKERESFQLGNVAIDCN